MATSFPKRNILDLDSFFESFQGLSDPGVEKTLFSFTVPSGKTRRLHSLSVTCSQRGVFALEKNGSVVASGRTGAGNKNVQFFFDPVRPALAGETVVLKYRASNDASESDLEAYLGASDK